jgi:glucose-1-phosphate thymidylyltransferase
MAVSAFILAAGKGTRMYPYSKEIIKPLLPVINKPLILHVIDRLFETKIRFGKIGVVIQKGEQQIPEIIDNCYPKVSFEYIIQDKPLGTGHAVLQLENRVNSNDFLVIAGDSLFPSKFIRKLVDSHKKNHNSATLALEKMNFDQMRHCSTVKFSNGRVWDIREKPKTKEEVLSDLNSAAMYLFSQSIFKALYRTQLSVRKEYELVSAIKELILQKKKIGGTIVSRVLHISNSHDLWHYNQILLSETTSKDLNGNLIGDNVVISESTKISNSVIGNHSQIRDNVELVNTVVLPNSIVTRNFSNSLVLSDYAETFLV